MKTKFSLGLAVQYGLAIFFMLLFSLPLLFMISSSFKDPQAIFGDVKSWRAFFPVGDVNFDQYLEYSTDSHLDSFYSTQSLFQASWFCLDYSLIVWPVMRLPV